MKKDDVKTKEEMYEAVYQSYANDIYRICLYFLNDESEAADVTAQVFVKYYKYYDEADTDCLFGCLVREAKKLIQISEKDCFVNDREEVQYERRYKKINSI